jgi:hypothetical protein
LEDEAELLPDDEAVNEPPLFPPFTMGIVTLSTGGE